MILTDTSFIIEYLRNQPPAVELMLKSELQGVISGALSVTNGTAIPAITNFIRKSEKAGVDAKKDKFLKEQEATAIVTYAEANEGWIRFGL